MQHFIRYLGHGESQTSLAQQFLVSRSTVTKIIPAVCKAIIKNLQDVHGRTPSTTVEWEGIRDKFNRIQPEDKVSLPTFRQQ